ncbi:MAG: GerMN domain-containing protein [Actinobacteria bacterium]|nr:GerMN domain-containing protein [Actinomycetota bacterium]
MRTKPAVVISALVFSLVVAGCASPTSRTPNPTPTPDPTRVPMQTVEMYYVGDTPTGFKLFSEKYSFQVTGDVAAETLSRLISGRAQPVDPDYTNLWGTGTSLNVYSKDGSTGVIDLKMGKLNVGAEAESRAIDQLLWTLSAVDPSITGVLLLVDGERIESLAGHGDATKVIAKAPDYEVLSELQISSFVEGESLRNPVIISGQGCTFEANLVWTLRRAGQVIKSAPTTAESACPDRSNWRVDLGNLVAGEYSFTVEDFSAKDGALSAKDDKNFTITSS